MINSVTKVLRRPRPDKRISGRLKLIASRLESAPENSGDPVLEWYRNHGHGD